MRSSLLVAAIPVALVFASPVLAMDMCVVAGNQPIMGANMNATSSVQARTGTCPTSIRRARSAGRTSVSTRGTSRHLHLGRGLPEAVFSPVFTSNNNDNDFFVARAKLNFKFGAYRDPVEAWQSRPGAAGAFLLPWATRTVKPSTRPKGRSSGPFSVPGRVGQRSRSDRMNCAIPRRGRS